MSVMWMVNDSGIDTFNYVHETSNVDKLILSSVTTSDTGRYTCKLTITTHHSEFIELLGPVESAQKEVIVQSIRVHSILYV